MLSATHHLQAIDKKVARLEPQNPCVKAVYLRSYWCISTQPGCKRRLRYFLFRNDDTVKSKYFRLVRVQAAGKTPCFTPNASRQRFLARVEWFQHLAHHNVRVIAHRSDRGTIVRRRANTLLAAWYLEMKKLATNFGL